MKKINSLVLSTLIAALLIGCGGGGSSSGTTNPTVTTTTGTFIDDKVSGVKYVNGSATGFTDANGQFPYTSGVISFYIGNIKLGEMSSLPSDNKVFVQDVVGVDRSNTTNTKVLKVASILQSLDSDTSTDAIEIKESDFNKFNDVTAAIDDNTNVSNILTSKIPTITVKTSDEIARHLDNSLKQYTTISSNTTPLTMSSTSILNGATNVSKDASIVLTFSNDIKKSSINKDTIVLKNASSNSVDLTITHEYNRVTIKPVSLDYSTTYSLTIKSSIEDYSGNKLGTTDTIIGFTTQSESDTSSPVFTSSSTVNINENQTDAFTASAIDDKGSVTYSLSGTDSSSFNIDSTTGVVTFKTAPDYETKNSYSVTIIATDTSNNSSSKDVIVSINNVLEAFQNGDTWKGLTYNIITSPITGKEWLDRNLGATQVCTSSTDTACYGDYYQFGRLADGHEKDNSDTTTIQTTDVANAGNKFIIFSNHQYDWLINDIDGALRTAQWSKTDGTGICPVGFRVPTKDELSNELTGYTGSDNISTGAVKVTNSITAFQNFLKFSLAGGRAPDDGKIGAQSIYIDIWANTADNNYASAWNLFIGENNVGWINDARSYGHSVRCVK